MPVSQSTKEKRLANLRPFKPGQSGNPGGRPKKVKDSAEELARKSAIKAVQRLVDVLDDTDAPAPAVVAAANSLLDRGLGKARQHIDMNHTMSLSDEFERLLSQVQENRRQHMRVIEGGKVIDG